MSTSSLFDSLSYTAGSLAAACTAESVSPNAEFFAVPAEQFVMSLLVAAAADQGTLADVTGWLDNPTNTHPCDVLGKHDELASWHDAAQAVYALTPRTKEAAFAEAQRCLATHASV